MSSLLYRIQNRRIAKSISGFPPFGIFIGEMFIIIGAFRTGHYVMAGIFVLSLCVIFAGFANQVMKISFDDVAKADLDTTNDRIEFKENGIKIYRLDGPLFFGSAVSFKEIFTPKEDPKKVYIDFANSHISDHSAIEAILNLVKKYEAENKTIHLKHLSEECKALLYKSDPRFHQVIINDIDDPRYHLAANPEEFPKSLSEYHL